MGTEVKSLGERQKGKKRRATNGTYLHGSRVKGKVALPIMIMVKEAGARGLGPRRARERGFRGTPSPLGKEST